MEKEFEAILIEFDALWGGADANSDKQSSWRKELVARLVNATQHCVHTDPPSALVSVSDSTNTAGG